MRHRLLVISPRSGQKEGFANETQNMTGAEVFAHFENEQ
jgi:hypothetical protein